MQGEPIALSRSTDVRICRLNPPMVRRLGRPMGGRHTGGGYGELQRLVNGNLTSTPMGFRGNGEQFHIVERFHGPHQR